MPTPDLEPSQHMRLRLDAETRLQAGLAPATQGWSTGAAALTLLHKLASQPDSAGDALKLLHELQVHQVGLDLQHEHMEHIPRELTEELLHYTGLFDAAPVSYFNVDAGGRVIDGNSTGARLLGVEWDTLGGQRLDGFLASGSRLALGALIARALASRTTESCEVQSQGDGDHESDSRFLQTVATVSPGGQSVLVCMMARE